jgi:hypothetical protein
MNNKPQDLKPRTKEFALRVCHAVIKEDRRLEQLELVAL